MKKIILAGAMALACSAGAAQAAVSITYNAGSGVLPGGLTVIQNFDAFAPGAALTGPGNSLAFAYANTVSTAAKPAFGSTGNFGAAIAGGIYNISFFNTDTFAFVLGSLDAYNSLTLRYADGSSDTFNGGAIANDPSLTFPGSRTEAEVNGVVTYRVTSGALITGATFRSTYDAFEFDNLATNVPEPAAWAMMIFGFALVGGSLRRRPAVKVNFA